MQRNLSRQLLNSVCSEKQKTAKCNLSHWVWIRLYDRTEPQTHTLVIPIAGLVSAALISEPRAHEHVLVDPSTQAVDV